MHAVRRAMVPAMVCPSFGAVNPDPASRESVGSTRWLRYSPESPTPKYMQSGQWNILRLRSHLRRSYGGLAGHALRLHHSPVSPTPKYVQSG